MKTTEQLLDPFVDRIVGITAGAIQAAVHQIAMDRVDVTLAWVTAPVGDLPPSAPGLEAFLRGAVIDRMIDMDAATDPHVDPAGEIARRVLDRQPDIEWPELSAAIQAELAGGSGGCRG